MEASLPADHLYGDRRGALLVRNVGGEATVDALRSLVLCRETYGIERVVVLGHTGCRLLERDSDRGVLGIHLQTQAARLRRHPSLQDVRVDIAVYDDASGGLVLPA